MGAVVIFSPSCASHARWYVVFDPSGVRKLVMRKRASAAGIAHRCRKKSYSVSLFVVNFNVNPAEGCVNSRVMTSLRYSKDRK